MESRELMLIARYLQRRKQSVVIDTVQSKHKLITHGVYRKDLSQDLLYL